MAQVVLIHRTPNTLTNKVKVASDQELALRHHSQAVIWAPVFGVERADFSNC